MKTFFFFCTLFLGLGLSSQNLVPNPSFEDTVQFSNGQPNVKEWQNNLGTPDYFTPYYMPPFDGRRTPVNIRGVEAAYKGVAYFGFNALNQERPNRREYMQTELLDTMIGGQKYEVEFYLSLADSFHWALDEKDIGVYLGTELIGDNSIHTVRYVDTAYISDSSWNGSNKNGWEKFHYTYTAKGGEKTIAIGSFKFDQDLTVDSVGSGGDFSWARQGSFYYIDNIRVERKDTNTHLAEIPLQEQLQLFPNPMNERFQLHYSGNGQLQFQLYNAMGSALSVSYHKEQNRYIFDSAKLPAAFYFLKVSDGKQEGSFKILKE